MDASPAPELSPPALSAWLLQQSALAPSPAQWQVLERLRRLLAAANEAHNLTRLVSPEDYLLRHVTDSLLVSAIWPVPPGQSLRVADVGCGAGFPGLPLALLLPAAEFTEIDSTQKKISFVGEAAAALGLANVRPLAARARELGHQAAHRGRYHLVLARAVAATYELIPECRRLLDPQLGQMIFFKTPKQMEAEEDLTQREAAKAKLTLTRSALYHLPGDAGERQFWLLRRAAP